MYSRAAVLLVVVALVGVDYAGAVGSRLDAPILAMRGATPTSVDVIVCADSTGAQAGFALQWQSAADYSSRGWDDASPTFGTASFSGTAVNSSYAMAPFECTTVTPGNMPADDGRGGTTTTGPLPCGTPFVFRAFAFAVPAGADQSDFSATYTFSTADCPPPFISLAVTPPPNAAGWNNSVTVLLDWTVDSLLPTVIDAGCVDETFSLETAGETRSCSAHNDVGPAEPAAVTIKIDTTRPDVTILCPRSPVPLNSGVVAVWTASDGGSGLVTPPSGGVVGDTSSVGHKTVSAPTATDAADNDSRPASCSYDVAYDWTGFLQPVDNLPTLNVAKAGSAIPVIFSLGGDQGLSVVAAGYPTSNVAACDASAHDDVIEATVSAGNSSLAYDPVANRYTYVWKTDKAWAGTCRQLRLKLVDGTLHAASFKFKT